ncbi:DegT/DnrJ/EryC1/StrS family aminotransferase [Paenibacillus marinisediminis]
MGELEQKLVQEAFDTNWIAPLGPHVDAFEQELANSVGSAGAVALSSGTAALHLALRLVGVGKGDVVFCSSFTFVASANPILYEGGEPVFIDSEPDTWNMSPQALLRAFLDAEQKGKLPKAVIVVNLYGQSADMEPIINICDSYGVPVIEDAAESLGATYGNKCSGTLGTYGIYSFNGNKIITTSGGGMLVSNNLEALEKARFWATQAREKVPYYEHREMGFNYRMSNISAAIGRGQLAVLQERVSARRAVYERYAEALSSVKGISFMPEADFGRSTRWLTAITLDQSVLELEPSDVVKTLSDYHIEARQVWKPMHLQPLFESCPYYPHEEHHSVCDELFASGICLPSASNLTLDNQAFVIEHLLQCLSMAVK